jgi:hypothetical protein
MGFFILGCVQRWHLVVRTIFEGFEQEEREVTDFAA